MRCPSLSVQSENGKLHGVPSGTQVTPSASTPCPSPGGCGGGISSRDLHGPGGVLDAGAPPSAEGISPPPEVPPSAGHSASSTFQVLLEASHVRTMRRSPSLQSAGAT